MAPAPTPSPHHPEQFGPYELYERLGMGGMATVYRAKKRGPEGFERVVALKRMLQHLAEDSSFVDGFIREAKVASMLAHPNIAQVYDFGRISGVYYIAMELVAGFDLRRLLRYASRANEPVALPVVFSILGELCDALEYAHSFVDDTGALQRIIHRDISPSNLIIAPTGHLKVIDFGIAKASMGNLRTETGMVKGKLGYMAPEVALGMSVGPGADIFSMGVVAWELITSTPLFTARTDFETMRKLRESEIQRPSQVNALCPPELDELVLQAIHRDVERRVPSAGEFRRRLDDLAARRGIAGSARAVADWIARAPHGDRSSRPSAPPSLAGEPPTAMLRPAAGTKLRRSQEDASLATDIWGEDAVTSAESLADFDAASMATSGGLPLRAPPASVMGSPAALQVPVRAAQLAHDAAQLPPGHAAQLPPARPTAPYAIPAPPGSPPYDPHSTQYDPRSAQYDPRSVQYPPSAIHEPAPRRSRWPLVVLPLIVIVVGAAAGYLWSRGHEPATTTAQSSGTATTPSPGAVTPAPPTPPPPAQPPVVAAAPPAPLDAAVAEPAETGEQPATPGQPAPHHATTGSKKHPAHGDRTHKVKPPEPAETPELPTPPAVTPPTPPPTPPVRPDAGTPAQPAAPARTPAVAGSAVKKLSGELPPIRGDGDGGDVLAKLCIDETGKVTSTKIVKAPPGIADKLTHAFDGWRYAPYINQAQKPSPVCFPVQVRVVVQSSN